MPSKNDQARLGIFQELSYVTIDDKYDKRGALDSRYRGKQFITAPVKGGKTNDSTFSPFSPLMVGERYTTSEAHERKYRGEMKKRNITTAPFKPSSPPKRNTGLGNYYGTIGKKYEHETDWLHDTSPRKKSEKVEQRNIVTAPAKKGTYGVPGTQLGVYASKVGSKGVVGEYVYKGEPYDLARQAEQEQKKLSDTSKVADKPFKPTSPAKKGTYGVPGLSIYSHKFGTMGGTSGICGEYAYEPLGTGKDEKRRPATSDGLKPFRPSNPPKYGYNCTFTPFPQYKGESLADKIAREKADRAAERKLLVGPAFKPVSCCKSVRTPSIANHPLNRSLQM
jgi:hypothetical protein